MEIPPYPPDDGTPSAELLAERRAVAAYVIDVAKQYMRGRYEDFAQVIVEAIAQGRHVELYNAGEYDDLAASLDRLFATGYLNYSDAIGP